MNGIQLQTCLRLKKLDRRDGDRWLIGTATTPSVDRMNDIVEPLGAQYTLPLVLLHQHDHARPVGTVTDASVSRERITVKMRLAENVLAADEVLRLLESGVPLALSIGFRALEAEPLPDGGQRYTRWEWLELSIVSVPANQDATLTPVGKGLVQSSRAAVTKQAEPVAFDPELFGQAVGEAIQRQIAPLRERIARLEGAQEARQ